MSIVWSKADLHVHSAHSDGAHDIQAILAHVAENTDLQLLAITDHDRISGAIEAQKLAPYYGLQVIIGEEITTVRGHLLALFIHSPIPPGLPLDLSIELVKAQGGLAILPHPLDRLCNSPMRHWPRPSLDDWRAFGLDGLESINGSQLDPLGNPRATALGQKLELPLIGGSDAHTKEVIGVAHTLFPGQTAADLRRALENGACIPAGRRWTPLEYAGWITKSFIPRTLRALRRPVPVPSIDPR